MNNLGKPVTPERLSAAESALKSMLPNEAPGERLGVLMFFKEKVERDEPAVLLAPSPPAEIATLDLTGRYRLLAALVGK